MEGRIEDINKAEEMAYASKSIRDKIADQSNGLSKEEIIKEERVADIREKRAGDAYEDREYEKKRKERVQVSNQAVENSGVMPEKFDVETLVDAGRKLFYVFKNRDSENLTQLISDEALSALSRAFSRLEEKVKSKKVEEVANNLRVIELALDDIGRTTTRGSFKENEEGLNMLIFALKNLQEACLIVKPGVAGIPLLSLKLDRINDIAESKWLFIAKRRDVLRSYNERRF